MLTVNCTYADGYMLTAEPKPVGSATSGVAI